MTASNKGLVSTKTSSTFEQCVHKILKENLCEFEETFHGHTEWFNITGENAVRLINSILPDFYIETLD